MNERTDLLRRLETATTEEYALAEIGRVLKRLSADAHFCDEELAEFLGSVAENLQRPEVTVRNRRLMLSCVEQFRKSLDNANVNGECRRRRG
jgi:hypothetical protein